MFEGCPRSLKTASGFCYLLLYINITLWACFYVIQLSRFQNFTTFYQLRMKLKLFHNIMPCMYGALCCHEGRHYLKWTILPMSHFFKICFVYYSHTLMSTDLHLDENIPVSLLVISSNGSSHCQLQLFKTLKPGTSQVGFQSQKHSEVHRG